MFDFDLSLKVEVGLRPDRAGPPGPLMPRAMSDLTPWHVRHVVPCRCGTTILLLGPSMARGKLARLHAVPAQARPSIYFAVIALWILVYLSTV